MPATLSVAPVGRVPFRRRGGLPFPGQFPSLPQLEEIVRRYMCCVDEEQENTRQNMANRNGGMQQTQMNENVARVRQPLRTED